MAFPRGVVGRPGKVFAWHWAGPSPVREHGTGHSGENSISGKTGIHFKMSAQQGQQGCSQARQGPQFPQFSPRGLQPHGGPWPESAGRHHIRYEARAGGAMSPPFSEQSGVWGARGRASGTRPWTALRTLPSPRPAPRSHLCWHYLGTALRVEKETRVNASVQHLREATEMGEREPSGERPPHHQKRGGTGGLEVERGRQEGASEPRGEEGPSASCGRPAVSQAGAGSNHGPSHLTMGEKLVSV